MIKDKVKDLLLNEIYNDWVYKVPSDKEHLLFDFYAFTLIEPSKVTDLNMRISLAEGKERIINTLIDEFKENVLWSLAAEMRHLLGGQHPFSKDSVLEGIRIHISKEIHDIAAAYVKNLQKGFFDIPNRRESYDAIKNIYPSLISTDKLANFFIRVFTSEWWSENLGPMYGGKSWAQIAEAWAKLWKVNTMGDKIVMIDHIYDLQHNTGSVFNKISAYSKEGGYSWLKHALDFKRDIKNPLALYRKISPGLKLPFAYAMKQTQNITLEEYEKNKTLKDIVPGDIVTIINDAKKMEELIMRAGEYFISNYALYPNRNEFIKYCKQRILGKKAIIETKKDGISSGIPYFEITNIQSTNPVFFNTWIPGTLIDMKRT